MHFSRARARSLLPRVAPRLHMRSTNKTCRHDCAVIARPTETGWGEGEGGSDTARSRGPPSGVQKQGEGGLLVSWGAGRATQRPGPAPTGSLVPAGVTARPNSNSVRSTSVASA